MIDRQQWVKTTTRRRGAAGFTLAELMIAVVIASILVAVAVPSFQAQMRKSRRTEARSALLDLAAREERFFCTNNFYSQNPADLDYGAAAATFFPAGRQRLLQRDHRAHRAHRAQSSGRTPHCPAT